MKSKQRMRKITSIFCALAVLMGVIPVSDTLYASAETTGKHVSESVMLSDGNGGYASTELKTFVKEDFEGYEDTVTSVFDTPYIAKYSSAYSATAPTLVATDATSGLNTGKAMKIKGTDGSSSGGVLDQTNSIVINPEYWAVGNKVTEMSFDLEGVVGSQIRFWWIWATQLDEAGRTTGTTVTTDDALGQGFLPCGNGSQNKATFVYFTKYLTNSKVTQQGANQEIYGSDVSTSGLDVHYKIAITYNQTDATTLNATTTLTAYQYSADGNYTTALGSRTYSAEFTCQDVNSLTLVPMIQANVNGRGATIDNLQITSIDSQAITYVSAYKDVFSENSVATEDAWKAATVAYNSLSELVRERLSYYGEAITEHYANAEKRVSSDFEDSFTDSMFWSNYDNLVIEAGNVTGVTNNTKKSVANGELVKDKALSVVYLKGVEASGGLYNGEGCAAIYPLLCETDKACHITNYPYMDNVYKMRTTGVTGSYDLSTNMYKIANSTDTLTLAESGVTSVDIAMFYDWSAYNAANDYKISITYVIDYTASGEQKSTVATVPYYLGTYDKTNQTQDYTTYFGTEIPQPADFKFAFRNLGNLDAVTVATVDETAGAVSGTGMYFKNTSGNLVKDTNNGAMVFTMQSDDVVTTLDNFAGVEVQDYGTLFINRATLAASNTDVSRESYDTSDDYYLALAEKLNLNTDKVMKIAKDNIGTIEDNHYNVRINGTQDDEWAGNVIFARTYVTYKIGTSTVTIYGDAMFKSNMSNLKEAIAKHDLEKGDTFTDTLTIYSTHLFDGSCKH